MNQLNFKLKGVKPPKKDKEYLLHREVKQRCKALGLLAFHSVMWRKTGRVKGELDFEIFGKNRTVLFIECKREGEYLTTEQEATATELMRFGFNVFVCRTLEDVNTAFESIKL